MARREFVDFAVNDYRAHDLLHWLQDTFNPDETFFNSLNRNPQLKIPGTYIGKFQTKFKRRIWRFIIFIACGCGSPANCFRAVLQYSKCPLSTNRRTENPNPIKSKTGINGTVVEVIKIPYSYLRSAFGSRRPIWVKLSACELNSSV